METNFNFKSQICTSREQSERLLALGLKKETADIEICCLDGEIRFLEEEDYQDTGITIPAWSLHRLIEMMPNIIREIVEVDGYAYMGSNKIAVTAKHIRYRFTYTHLDREKEYTWKYFHKDNLYDNAVDCIEWLIKEGYFNKEYLV